MKTILFMGPMPPPYTGQSIAFSIVVNNLKNEKSKIINISNKNTVLRGIGLCFQITYQMLFHRFDQIYFTCSRSISGSVRDLVLLFWARIRHVPVVNHLHGGDFKLFYKNLPAWYQKIVHWCYTGIKTSIVLAEGMKSEFSDFPHMNIEVIANGYSSELDQCPKEKTTKKEGHIQVIYLSNIMKMKGILHLLDAFEQIFPIYPNVSLSIAGVPIGDMYCPEEEITNAFFDRYNKLQALYPDRIHYLGLCSGEKKTKLLWQSDVFVLPTYHPTEAFPISILEALRTGNYVITTDHRLIPEIVSDNNGKLIQPDSMEAIVNALQEIINQPKRLNEIQNHNIQDAMEKYGESKYVEGVKKITEKFN